MTSANDYLQAINDAVAGHPFVFQERAATKLAEEQLKQLQAAPEETRVEFVVKALEVLPNPASFVAQFALKGIVSSLLRGMTLSTAAALRILAQLKSRREAYPYRAILSAVQTAPMSPELRAELKRVRANIDDWLGARDMKDLHDRIDTMLEGPKPELPVRSASAWSTQVFAELVGTPHELAWRALFLHARSLTQSVPTRKWLAEAAEITARLGESEIRESATRWLALGPMPGKPDSPMPEEEADYQKGFIFAVAAAAGPALASAIGDYCVACFRKIPQIGAVSHRVGNACVNSLSALPGFTAVAQLSRLAARVKYDVARRLIEKALNESAARNHVSRDDLEAMSVPTFGLDESGERTEQLGECEARLAIVNSGAQLTWTRAGKPLKSVPADVKSAHGPQLAELKKAAKELDAILSTQRLRIERQFITQSQCSFDRWRAWYLDHPVISTYARRLIWEFTHKGQTQTAIWHNGALVDWANQPIAPVNETTVRLWHPIRSDVQTVMSWRCWLEDHGVRQPFKQAHREVYLLTDAERQSGDHSFRFAAHLLRQHQFSALCRERGWQFNLMGAWDSHNTPTLALPQHRLQVQFDVEFPDNEETTAHAVYLVIGTGPVSFLNPQGQPLPLDTIPPQIFSEVMRDVDLFVGVTSIGADPAWSNEDRGAREAEYWNHFAFGDLTEFAKIRRSVIESLLPKLAIRDRCRVDNRYLVVKGDLHEYRIHLGSGNVMIEPGSRYLCIVPGPGDTAASLPLPFEGDRTLAVILSKAFLLAKDKAINDPSILFQLRV